MNTLFKAAVAQYCQLKGTDQRRAYVPADKTTPEHLAEVFRQHAPILACEIGDDYDRVVRDDWLSAPGGFR